MPAVLHSWAAISMWSGKRWICFICCQKVNIKKKVNVEIRSEMIFITFVLSNHQIQSKHINLYKGAFDQMPKWATAIKKSQKHTDPLVFHATFDTNRFRTWLQYYFFHIYSKFISVYVNWSGWLNAKLYFSRTVSYLFEYPVPNVVESYLPLSHHSFLCKFLNGSDDCCINACLCD